MSTGLVRSAVRAFAEAKVYADARAQWCISAARRAVLTAEGQIAEAPAAYRAPVLSRSGAMGAQLLRDQLALALGSAVRSSADLQLLIRSLSTDMGAADFRAVEAPGMTGGSRDALYLTP